MTTDAITLEGDLIISTNDSGYIPGSIVVGETLLEHTLMIEVLGIDPKTYQDGQFYAGGEPRGWMGEDTNLGKWKITLERVEQ